MEVGPEKRRERPAVVTATARRRETSTTRESDTVITVISVLEQGEERTTGMRAIHGVGLIAAIGAALPASAGLIDIGGGWEASWSDDLDSYVDIVSNGVVGDAVFIEKAAEFTQGSVGGIFPGISVIFRQTAPDAVGNIVIDDEIITNSTGEDWTGFRMDLVDGVDALFDPVATAASGGAGPIGFTISPFTTADFSADLMTLTIGGGVVPDGDIWLPGDQGTNGQLWINVNTLPGDTQFILKETPVPGPGALVVLAVGGAMIRRRRRLS
jgi:hypothetical protein